MATGGSQAATTPEGPAGARVTLAGVSPAAFQHPRDYQALTQLQRIRGFETFVSRFVSSGVERMEYTLNTAGSVRVGPSQLPRLYAHLAQACAALGVPEPELYVSDGGASSFASGQNRPYIVLMSGLLDLLDDDELLAAVAHDVGHIKAGHLLYKSMASAVSFFGEIAGDLSLGLSRYLTAPLQAGLLAWDRQSEFTADRAALLVTQDSRVCLSLLMKLAAGGSRLTEQLNLDAFIEQVRAYDLDADATIGDRFYRFAAGMYQYQGSGPFAVLRARALLEWIESGEYRRLLAAAAANAPDGGLSPTDYTGTTATEVTARP